MHPNPPASLPWIVAAFLSFAGARAQTTWTVTQQNGVQAAIAAGAPGDVILLPNTGGFPDYTPFSVTKGVTIRGYGCRIGWPLGASTTNEITIQVPPGERAHLDGLDLSWSAHTAGNIGMRLVHNGGVATVQRCTVQYSGGDAVRVLGGAIVFQTCSLYGVRLNGYNVVGTSVGLFVQGGTVTMRDSTAAGSDARVFWFGSHAIVGTGQAGALVAGGSLHAERSAFTGGSGVVPPFNGPGGPGVLLQGSAVVYLSDCTLTGGNTGGAVSAGGAALNNSSTNVAQLANVTLVPGMPGGSPTYGSVNPTAPLFRMAITPAFQRGVTSTLQCQGEPGALFVLGVALDSAPSQHPFLVEPVWIVVNVPVAFGLLDAAGGASIPVAVPAGPGLENALVWCQAVSGFALPLRATTIAGGLIP